VTGEESDETNGRDDGTDKPLESTHRGGFGEFGADSTGFIDRSFRERIVLVGVAIDRTPDEVVSESLDELSSLVDTAGADAIGRVVQRRKSPDASTFVGSGKANEIKDLAIETDCDTVVFDDDLTPAQQFNLEKLLGRTAIDRSAVILDIFAQNASSQEGKAQVELAQLRYRLPRLRGRGGVMSQQAGGIGTRGPGETQLEVDRRRLIRRVHKLEKDLVQISRHRSTQRKSRKRSGLRHIAIVGYTNAGKSTLLNRLTDAGVLVEDRLFATLDATTRRLSLPGGEVVLATDTVGFVRKLPHQLVEAFTSTLEVAAEADLLVHVVDSSAADPDGQIEAVHGVLVEIGAGDVPELLVFNKGDLAPDAAARLVRDHPGSVDISAKAATGLDELRTAVSDRLRAMLAVVELRIPYDRGDVLASLHRGGEVLSEVATEDAMIVRARVAPEDLAPFEEFSTSEP
jgi:GTP-binding protein HflX